MPRPRRSVIVAIVVAVVALAGPAFAYWTISSSGVTGKASAHGLVAPAGASATALSSTSIRVSYTPSTQSVPAAQYRVTRSSGPGSPATVCTVASTTTSCDDTGLTAATQYGYTVAAVIPNTSWASSGVTASATTQTGVVTRTLTASVSADPVTAGQQFTMTIQAMLGSAVDATYTGNKTITFSGPLSSPGGTAPLYNGSASTTKTISFTAGSATFPVVLYNAVASPGTAITVSDGTHQANTPKVAVNAAAPSALCWIGAPSCTGGSTNVAVSTSRSYTVGLVDAYGNTAKAVSTVTVTISQRGNNGSVTTGTQQITAGNSQVANATTLTSSGSNNRSTTAQAEAPGLTTATVAIQT